jgi:hypothetical protein
MGGRPSQAGHLDLSARGGTSCIDPSNGPKQGLPEDVREDGVDTYGKILTTHWKIGRRW